MNFTKNRHATKGFTLLELLLVVGVAAILIVSGISVYSNIRDNAKLNEMKSLLLIVEGGVRDLRSKYSVSFSGTPYEEYLYNTGKIPDKYLSTTPGQIAGPYPGSFTVDGIGSTLFRINFFVSTKKAVELLQIYDPSRNNGVHTVFACGLVVGSNQALPDIPTLSQQCLSSSDTTRITIWFK